MGETLNLPLASPRSALHHRFGIVTVVSRHALLAAVGWLAAAVAAVLTGLAAVAVIGDGLTGPAGPVRSESEVAAAVAATPGASGSAPAPGGGAPSPRPDHWPGPSGPATPSPLMALVRRAFSFPGGSVVAECANGYVHLVSWSPATGYTAVDVERGPDDDAEISFVGGGRKIEVSLGCRDGQPVAEWEEDD
jgi:hypothetical protein